MFINVKKDLVEDINSCKNEIGTNNSKIIRHYDRNNAIDRYNLEYCEYMRIQRLQPNVDTVKDSNNMYYKMVETLIDKSENAQTNLSR